MDQQLEFLVNRAWTHPALDRLMAAASSFDLWLPLLIVLALLTAWRGGARARWFLVCLGLTLAINDGLIGQTLKRAVHRPRPFQAQAGVRQIDLDRHARPRLLGLFRPLDVKISPAPDLRGGPPEGRSFPSSHTTNNFCAATLLAWFYRRRGWWYFAVAGLVGYSRVYTGAHWPSDVFASACLATGGVLTAAALWEISNNAFQRTETGGYNHLPLHMPPC